MEKYKASYVLQGWTSSGWWTLRAATLADIVRFANNPKWRIVEQTPHG
jgi:uncharacterized membrane protein